MIRTDGGGRCALAMTTLPPAAQPAPLFVKKCKKVKKKRATKSKKRKKRKKKKAKKTCRLVRR